MYNVSTKKNKDVRINLKTTDQLRRDFQVAAELRGSTMSNLIHQFIVATIWDEKKKHPVAFEEAEQAALNSASGGKPARTPTIMNSGAAPKPTRRERINDQLNSAFGRDGQPMTENDRETIRKLEEENETPDD